MCQLHTASCWSEHLVARNVCQTCPRGECAAEAHAHFHRAILLAMPTPHAFGARFGEQADVSCHAHCCCHVMIKQVLAHASSPEPANIFGEYLSYGTYQFITTLRMLCSRHVRRQVWTAPCKHAAWEAQALPVAAILPAAHKRLHTQAGDPPATLSHARAMQLPGFRTEKAAMQLFRVGGGRFCGRYRRVLLPAPIKGLQKLC